MRDKTRNRHPDDGYRTSDLYYAAFLKTAGVPLKRVDREGSKVFFVFEKSDSIGDLQIDYFNRRAKVPALTFSDEIRHMKSLTFLSHS